MVAVNPVEDALPRVVCPVTLSVPLEVKEEVAVIDPPVRVLIVAVIALSAVAKKLEEVAFVVFSLVTKRSVTVKDVADALLRTVLLLTVRNEVEAFVRVESPVEVKLVVKISVAERPVVDAWVITEVDAKMFCV